MFSSSVLLFYPDFASFSIQLWGKALTEANWRKKNVVQTRADCNRHQCIFTFCCGKLVISSTTWYLLTNPLNNHNKKVPGKWCPYIFGHVEVQTLVPLCTIVYSARTMCNLPRASTGSSWSFSSLQYSMQALDRSSELGLLASSAERLLASLRETTWSDISWKYPESTIMRIMLHENYAGSLPDNPTTPSLTCSY